RRELPCRLPTCTLPHAVLPVGDDRDTHAARPRDLLDDPGDVLVTRAGFVEIARADLGPDELPISLPDEPRKGEPPEAYRLEALVSEDVVRDRLQIGAGGAEPRGALERAGVGARELE